MEKLDYTMAMVRLVDGSLCMVDLTEPDDLGDIEPFVDQNGNLRCTLGVEGEGENMDTKRLEITEVYFPSDLFNGKFPSYAKSDLKEFVARFLEGEYECAYDSVMTAEELLETKDHYGVSDRGSIRRNP